NWRRLHDGDARPQVVAEAHHAADVLDARLQVFRLVEPAAQWTSQCREVKVEGAEEIAKLAAAGLRQALGRQVADRIDLNSGRPHLRDRFNRPGQRQAKRFEPDSELHGLIVAACPATNSGTRCALRPGWYRA